ncbi:hypothetical protein MJO29_007851 [Puccinia striiformis f. sp. tritici]|uniref:hypothetical protein n=1 Tax=Puccinia striiformis f. sp. tritici TaxID=168172 RepID=UPI0020088D44|nr:hypothetical protein Pst134EA_016032 [Puccinia striiformis f. sp. tritici]KAH9463953.1 hypothetical protein Pst134EA_016032 [Puccinia striiformis f. sp. tritici]KAI7952220.1 hypothetical protein MJO29_007851 [Puccinia striiformis f. sp. tritici]
MNDFSSGPLEMTVEKTADEQTMVKVDQANPISFQQNIPPRNANRYMTNGSGSCEDPKVTLLLPSAPGRGVVLRSSHLVPPVWFTENPQDGTPEGNIEKQYVTSPRALPAGLKRKRQDAQSSINNSESRIPADSSPDLEVQSIAHGGFKLMGFPIEPGRYTHQFQGADRMKGPDEKKTALISDSTSETDGDSIDAFLSKQHVDTSSSSPPVTPKQLPRGPVFGHNSGSVRGNTIGPKVPVLRQDQTTLNLKPERMKFDVDLFKSSASLTSNGGELPLKLANLFFCLGGSELVMTEHQFLEYHSAAFRDYKLPGPAELYPEKEISKRTHPSSKRNQRAMQFLADDLAPWRRRYREKLGMDLESRVKNISVASGKPLGAMEKLIFSYLNFVEMISTIVPKDKETNDIDLELEKALRLVESIYETRQPHELLHHSAIESQRSDIKARLLGKRNAHASVRLWVLLDIWIETCRTTLSEKILGSTNSRTVHNLMKEFFWVVFFVYMRNFAAQTENTIPQGFISRSQFASEFTTPPEN